MAMYKIIKPNTYFITLKTPIPTTFSGAGVAAALVFQAARQFYLLPC